MEKLPREPRVENRYSLTIEDIKNLKIGNRELIGPPLFYWNDIIYMWYILDFSEDIWDDTSFWLGVFTEKTTPEDKLGANIHEINFSNEFAFNFSSHGGMCKYTFNTFYAPEEIPTEEHLVIQEKFLEKINELIDKGVLVRS